jgi:hypothetical protein
MKTKELNTKELAVLRQCADAPSTLDEMSSRFRRADNKAQANSWARNSVRRPVRMGLMKKLKRGTYGLTAKGRALIDGGEKAKAA